MASQTMDEKIKLIEDHIGSFPDFPRPGILFRDIFTALADGHICKVLKDVLVEYIKINFPGIDMVVGLESRGFLFCFSIAAELEISCIPVRKKGKLPGKVLSYDYTLEYGTDTFEIQTNMLSKPGQKCLIVDDLIATGGSMSASINLLRQAGCEVVGCLVVMELVDLNGRDKLPKDIAVHSLIKY